MEAGHMRLVVMADALVEDRAALGAERVGTVASACHAESAFWRRSGAFRVVLLRREFARRDVEIFFTHQRGSCWDWVGVAGTSRHSMSSGIHPFPSALIN